MAKDAGGLAGSVPLLRRSHVANKVAIVPLATPILAGPGTITTQANIYCSGEQPGHLLKSGGISYPDVPELGVQIRPELST